MTVELLVDFDLVGWSSHMRLVFPCSSWFEDAPGSARPVPCSLWDGPPCWHERRADQPRCRLCQFTQHVSSDECCCRCSCCGGLRALPNGRQLWWALVGLGMSPASLSAIARGVHRPPGTTVQEQPAHNISHKATHCSGRTLAIHLSAFITMLVH
jgi:hypothetical protein